ncbi:MAG: glutamate 5-kinase, partial [Halothiobacillaceae bacterium]
MKRAIAVKARRWVVKIGSAMVTAAGRGLDRAAIDGWVRQIAALRGDDREVLIVTSGSVAEGMARLGWSRRPEDLPHLQAAAAVGQMGLVQAYESVLKEHGIHSAQILLTHEDLSDRQRYLNARSTLRTLLSMGVIPVVNENDTVATEEIRFGDNDTLAALIANLVEAAAIREVGQGWPILVLSALLPGEETQAVHLDVMPTVSSVEEVDRLELAARRARRTLGVHLKIDTGMGRLGVWHPHTPAVYERIRDAAHLELAGLFTHFASS